MQVNDWKRWELWMLKGSIVLVVFPMMTLVGGLLGSAFIDLPLLSKATRFLEGGDELVGDQLEACWFLLVGLAVSVTSCRQLWPRNVVRRPDREGDGS